MIPISKFSRKSSAQYSSGSATHIKSPFTTEIASHILPEMVTQFWDNFFLNSFIQASFFAKLLYSPTIITSNTEQVWLTTDSILSLERR